MGERSRRAFLRQANALFALAALPPFPVLAQQVKPKRLGLLYFGSQQSFEGTGRRSALIKGMGDAGYREGKDFAIEGRFADGDESRLGPLAAELVKLKVDVILTVGSQGARAAFQSSASIPIVSAAVADPVGEGYAVTLAEPGRNVTGLASNLDVMPKQLDLLVTVAPNVSRLAVLRNGTNAGHDFFLKQLMPSAQAKGVQVFPIDAGSSADFEQAFGAMKQHRCDGLIVLGDTSFLQRAKRLTSLALQFRLPAVFSGEQYVRTGGLMSYGFDDVQNFYLVADFIGKIFKGANPATLPFAQHTRYDLVINRTTARTLGLRIPDPLLLRADKLID